jgi:hypothetical protein
VIRGREEKCAFREHSGMEALGGGVSRGDGTTPTGELLNKHTDREACPYQWKGIMEHVETRLSKVTLIRSGDTAITEGIRNAVIKYGQERIDWFRRFLETPDGAEYPPAAPLY